MFELLGQFFAGNVNLHNLVVEYNGCGWITKSSIRALCAGTSVRQIMCSKNPIGEEVTWDWEENAENEATWEEEELVCALIKRYPLQKLCFGHKSRDDSGALIGQTVSSYIKSILEDPNCKLESLSLYNIGKCTHLSVIASGLAKNTSVKAITYNGDRPHLLLGINAENYTLEVLDLNSRGQDYNSEISKEFSVALDKFRALKRLNLSQRQTTPGVLSAIFKVVLMPPFNLEGLFLRNQDMNDESLGVLGECIAANKTLKKLNLSGLSGNISWASFFRQLHKTPSLTLESINLQNNESIDNSVLRDVMDFFRRTANLKIAKLHGCGVSLNDVNVLLDMLHQTSIQNIDNFCSLS
jgi:hypothetical protein